MERRGRGGTVRRVVLRSVLVLVAGAAVLVPILYYASTEDVHPPQIQRIALTQHLVGDDNVALTTSSLEVVFSEAVDRPGAQSAFRIVPAQSGAFSWSGSTMVFTPVSRLPLETSFTVSFASGIRDLAGNPMGSSASFAFRTVGGPTVVDSEPANEAVDVALDAPLQLTFSTLMDTASVQRALQLVPHTDLDLRWNGERLTLVPTAALLPGQRYQLVIGTGATDLAGTALSDALRIEFTTVAAGLTPRAVVPLAGSQGIAVTTAISLVFDRALDPASVSDRSVTVVPAVPGDVRVAALDGAAGLLDKTARVLTFRPSGTFAANTTYAITVASTIRGTDGTQPVAPLTWTFTTGAPSVTLGNQVVFLSDRSGVANLWAMNSDGSNQRQLSAELSPVTSYAVAPNGRSFVVGDGKQLIEERADGTGRRVLTDGGQIEFDPTYAPDGSAIAFGRADATTGAGLGLWRRPPGGGDAERIAIAAGPSPTASAPAAPSASAATSAQAQPGSLLRAPRYSPDGTHLAYVDMSGRVGIVRLASGTTTTAPFQAVAPPAWLPGGEGVVVSGLKGSGEGTGRASASPPPGVGTPAGSLTPGTAVPPLTPSGLRLSAAQRASLVVGELDRDLSLVQVTFLDAGATLPAVDASGRIAYLVLDPQLIDAGQLRITDPFGRNAMTVSPDGRAMESSVSFAPEPDTLVVTRIPVIAEPTPRPSASPGTATPSAAGTATPAGVPTARPQTADTPAGIWLINLTTGAGHQLSRDGWMPRWLP